MKTAKPEIPPAPSAEKLLQLIQELIAYRADLDQLRAARTPEPQTGPDELPGDPYTLLRDYEVIKITTDAGTPAESVMKIVAPKPQITNRRTPCIITNR